MCVEPNTTETYDTATVNFYYTSSELVAMGADESGFTICAWNGTAWEPLNTTVDFNGRVVSANTTHFSIFALVAAELPSNILGPVVSALLLSGFGQPPMGGSMLWILGGIAAVLLAVIAVAIVILARRH
jgi:hypothetical protein